MDLGTQTWERTNLMSEILQVSINWQGKIALDLALGPEQ